MKAILEFDTDEPQQSRELRECTNASAMAIALWDMDQLFRSAMKYENVIHDGYLDEGEYEVMEFMRRNFHKILEEADIKFVLGG